MREVDGVVDAVAVTGVDADELRAVADLDLAQDAEVLAAAALADEADTLEGLDVRERAAVEDGDFEVVDFDDDVIDAKLPMRAKSRCSVVEMRTDPRMRLVA